MGSGPSEIRRTTTGGLPGGARRLPAGVGMPLEPREAPRDLLRLAFPADGNQSLRLSRLLDGLLEAPARGERAGVRLEVGGPVLRLRGPGGPAGESEGAPGCRGDARVGVDDLRRERVGRARLRGGCRR